MLRDILIDSLLAVASAMLALTILAVLGWLCWYLFGRKHVNRNEGLSG